MTRHLAITLRLYFRNRLALVYGYVFPVVYFVAFYVLYRFERASVTRHMGELLTVTILASACFGLPTTLVSDREAGVWRRYRLAPVPMASLLVTTTVARYLLLLSAGVLQLVLAFAVGAPAPSHPLLLLAMYTAAAFAFIGFGLVLAMIADNVPAVQALGQCIFLPMLIIGGVAVQMSSLPVWARHFAAFLPGRYAVDAIQAAMTGTPTAAIGFAVGALALIGAASYVAAARLFRWDAHGRFLAGSNKHWVTLALVAWVAVGAAAEWRAYLSRSSAPAVSPPSVAGPAAPAPASQTPERPLPVAAEPRVENPASAVKPPASTRRAASPATGSVRAPWESARLEDVDAAISFNRLPPDLGVVAPLAPPGRLPDDENALQELEVIRAALPEWAPGLTSDQAQNVRNLLFVAAIADVFQLPIEPYVPRVVFDLIQERVPADQLIRVCSWIALNPDEGSAPEIADVHVLGLSGLPDNMAETRQRVAIYAAKLLGRLAGRIAQP